MTQHTNAMSAEERDRKIAQQTHPKGYVDRQTKELFELRDYEVAAKRFEVEDLCQVYNTYGKPLIVRFLTKHFYKCKYGFLRLISI